MYLFEELTPALLEATRDTWMQCLEQDDPPFSPVGYESFISYCHDIQSNPERHECSKLYAAKKQDENFASGIFMFTYALPRQPNAWIKVLSTRTSPRLDSRWGDEGGIPVAERLRKVSSILITGLFEIYRLSESDMPCDRIKIYANKQADRDLFVRFIEELEKNPETRDLGDATHITLDAHGQWLVLEKVKP